MRPRGAAWSSELSEDERRQRDQVELPRILCAQRPHHRAVVAAGAAQRSDPDVHQCRHGAVQERLHRAREAPLCAGRDGAEMRARRRQAQRPRQCRLYGAPPHLLRDARQFLVRRLFQGPRHRARLEPGHQGIRPGQGTAVGDGASLRRERAPALAEDRRTCPRPASSATPTICGRWGRLVRAAIARRSSTIKAPSVVGGPPGSLDEDGDRFLEFWNLVFMQYEQVDEKTRIELPRPSIDTGMGLERITAILQGVTNNYEIDLFQALIRERRQPDRRRSAWPAEELAPRHRRSSARLGVPDRRRGAAFQRGARLRAAPHHAPRHAPRRIARRQGAADVAAGAGAGARDGPGLSGAASRRCAHHRDAQARGDPLPPHAGARPCDPRRCEQDAQEGRHVRWRDRFHALRHLRLSARSHRRMRCARAASASISRPSPTPWSASARRRAPPGRARARRRPRRSGLRCARRPARPSFSATRPSAPKAWWRRWCARAGRLPRSRPARPAASFSTRRRSTGNPAARSAIPAS